MTDRNLVSPVIRQAWDARLTELVRAEEALKIFDPVTDHVFTEVDKREQRAAERAARKFSADIDAAQRRLPYARGIVLPTIPVARAAAAVAREAGICLMRYFNTEAHKFSIQYKEKAKLHSAVTDADRDAEKIIRAGLRALSSKTPFLGEETYRETLMNGDFKPDREGQYWCVDGLDSTKSFLEGHKQWTVNIALIRHRRPVLGVVYAPAMDRLFIGVPKAKFAVVQTPTQERAIHTNIIRPPEKRTAVVSYTNPFPEKLKEYKKKYGVHRSFKESSSLRMCWLAQGKADLYFQFAELKEHDVAAAHAVVEAAGGYVGHLETHDRDIYGNRKGDMTLPPLLVAGRKELIRPVFALTN